MGFLGVGAVDEDGVFFGRGESGLDELGEGEGVFVWLGYRRPAAGGFGSAAFAKDHFEGADFGVFLDFVKGLLGDLAE